MAKDTEKLIRQLSLISYLMAERRPVTAPEIRRDVEGYSVMNEDAFARRFYADRSELAELGIVLSVEKPQDGQVEQENYSLPPENFHLPAIEFSDDELAALWTALYLLDGKFAYAEPLRLALQQISWGRPSPLDSPVQRTIALGITGAADGHEVSQRLAKIETAIFRRKTIVFEYYTMERDDKEQRRVDPYQLLFQGGQFYVVGRSHERDAIRVFRLSRIQGKVGYATKAEHDFQRPADFDPRAYADRIPWQFGEPARHRRDLDLEPDRLADRSATSAATASCAPPRTAGSIFVTSYSNARQLIAWVLGLGDNARIVSPPSWRPNCAIAFTCSRRATAATRRSWSAPEHELRTTVDESSAPAGAEDEDSAETRRRRGDPAGAVRAAGDAREHPDRRRPLGHDAERGRAARAAQALRPGAAGGHRGPERRQLRRRHLRALRGDPGRRDDRGRPRAVWRRIRAAGAAAAGRGQGADRGDRPDRRAHPARARSPRCGSKVVAALGEDPAHEGLQIAALAATMRRSRRRRARRSQRSGCCSFEYYKENEGVFSTRVVEPYQLVNGLEGWYVASYDPDREAVRHFRLDRIKSAQVTETPFTPRTDLDFSTGVDGWLRTGEVPASSRARVWISPDRARWVREERTVISEGDDGSVVVDFGYAGLDWLVRNVLKEAGDAVVLEPAEAREAVRGAAAEIEAAVPV